MARKPTKAELRKALLVSEWGEEDLADSRVLAIRERLKQEEEKRNAPPNFDNVRSGSSTKGYDAGRTSLDKMGAAFTGGLADVGADLMFGDIDAEAAEKLRRAEEDARIAGNNETFLGNLAPDFLERDFVSPTAAKLAAAMGETNVYKKGFQGLSKYAEEKRAEVDQEVKANIDRNPVRGRIERTLLDVAGSPQSLASIPGGAFAAIPAMTTYNDAYRKMREGGASPEASNRYAEQQMAVEGGISTLPAGNVLKIASAPFRRGLANVVTKPFRNNAADIALRTGRTAVGEGIEESVQTVAADLVNQATAAFGDDPKAREVAKQAISKDLFNDTLRAGAAGFAGGGGLGGIHSSLQVARENARLVVEANKRLDQDEGARTRQAEASARNRAGPLDRSNDIDVDKANSLLIGEDWRREAATKRLDTVNSRIQETQAELAQLNDAEFKAKMAEEAGEPATPFDITRKKRVGQTLVNLEMAKTQLNDMLGKDAQGRAMLDAKAQRDAAAQAEAARVAEAEARAQPRDTTGLGPAMGIKPVNKRQAARNEAEAKRKAEEASLREYANGGSTASQTAPAGSSAARTLVQNLSKNRGSADSKRALSLLASGRLEIVNNLGDLGIQAKPGTVTKGMERDGKMYIFADAFDNSADLAPQLAATLFHETKHAADFGEGDVNLPSNLAGFIGMENTAPINRKIEEAANRGNKIAQQAVANAELARSSERNPARKDTAYEEELLPHLISETKMARNKASGLGNIIADVRNAVKGQYNTMFGTDEGVSVDDVFKLSEKLTDYVAQNQSFNTQPKQLTGDKSVDRNMIVGKQAASFPIADELGLTYTSKDGGQKFYISDKTSDFSLSPDTVRKIKESPKAHTISLTNLLKHEDIYNEYPELRDVKVKATNIRGDIRGQYTPGSRVIVLNKKYLEGGKYNSATHQVLLHELQHIIQEIEGHSGGSNPSLFLPEGYNESKMQEQQLSEEIVAFAKDAYRGSFKKYGISPRGNDPEYDNAVADMVSEAEASAKARMKKGYESTEQEQLNAALAAIAVLSMDKATNTPAIKALTNKSLDLAAVMNDNIAMYRKAHRKYEENLGEEEARYTQKNIDLDPDEAPTNPEKIYFPDAAPDMGEAPDARAMVPGQQPFSKEATAQLDKIKGVVTDPKLVQEVLDRAWNSYFWRGDHETGKDGFGVTDGQLGPGNYLTEDPSYAASYGPNVTAYSVDISKPLIIANVEGMNLALALASDTKFHEENFFNLGAARAWARDQFEDWAGIGDPDFPSMLRDAGYDSVIQLKDGDIVEMNVLNQRQISAERDISPPTSTQRFSESGAEIAQVKQSPARKKAKTVLGLFSAFGELGRELGVKAEEAVGEASYFADLAQITSLRIKRGTKQAAERLVAEGKATSLTQGIELMNKRIKGTLDSLVQIEEEARRQSAIAGLVREYPELAGIQDGYNLINDGTRQIVRQMLASKTGPMTDSEIAKMKTLIKNQTRYLTRAYAAFQGNDGKTWSQKLENEYSIAKAMVAKGAAIPAKYQESYRTYKAALDYIARENVAIFDEAALSEMTLDKVRMVYDTWFSNRKGIEDEIKRTNDPDEAGVVKEQLIDAIVARGKEVNDRQISNRAHKIINGLLGLNETSNPVVSYYRGFKQDKSILMDRVELPQELKDLFGEITDPALRIMLTISKQGELAARTNLLLAIKNDMYGRKIISNEDKAEDNNDTFSEQLKGDSWGPLADHWVTPEVWTTIRDDREIATNMEDAIGRLVLDANAVNTKLGVKALSYYTRLAGLQKVAAIVWNPAQTIWNFGGSWITGIKEGNVNPQNYVRAGKAAAKLFAKELQAAGAGGRILQNDPDVEDLIRYDVIDSAMVQEIRKLPNQYIRQMINDHGHVRNVLGKSADISFAAVKQIFALSDLTVKIANYYHQVNMLEAYYEAKGMDVPADTLKKEAADVIKDTNITFRRAAPIVKMGERAGLTYVMPYIQGVFRSSIYGYVHGIKDLVRMVNDDAPPKAKAILFKHAMGRIVGSTTAIVLVQALVKSVLTGDEEKDAKIRQLQTLDARYGDSVYVGDDAKGNPLMLRFSRFDPLGPLTDIVRIAHSDSTTEQKNRDIAEHVHGLLIKPRLGQEILKSALEFVTNDKTPAVKPKGTKLERLFPRMTTATKDFLADAPGTDYNDGEALMGLLDTMLPGFTNIIDPNNAAVTGQSPQYKKPDASDSIVADMLRATGGRMDKIDVNMAAFVAGKDLSTVRMEARTRVFDKLQTVDATDRDAVMAITELLDDERKAFIRVKEVYEGMEAMGMSKRQIDTVLKDEGKLTEHDRHLLYSGKYDTSLEGWRTNGSSVLSKKSIEQRELQSDKRSPDEQTAAEKREAVKKAVKVLRELGIKVKE